MTNVSALLANIASIEEECSSERAPNEPVNNVTKIIKVTDVVLNLHQGIVAENAGAVAASFYRNNEQIADNIQQELEECVKGFDGTNACPFLALKNADILYSTPDLVHNKEALKSQVESVMQSLPSKINDIRDANVLSNIEEAMEVLNAKSLLEHKYDLHELIKDQLCINVAEKQKYLQDAIMEMTESDPSLAIYTCSPICMVIGFVKETFILIDTHCIGEELGGNGNGFIKFVCCEASSEARLAGVKVVFNWLEHRMRVAVGNNKGPESLLRLSIVESIITCHKSDDIQ